MKKLWHLMLICVLFVVISANPLYSASKSKSKVKYFAPGSLYFYVLGSFNHFAPPDVHYMSLGYANSNAFGPVFGVGYRVLNIRDKFFLNIEGDFSTASYDFDYYTQDQKINILTVMFNAEGYISNQFPMILFCGIGLGSHHISDMVYEDFMGDLVSLGNDNILVLALDIGLKIPVSKHIFIRTEYQWNGEISGDYEYYDEYWDYQMDDTNWDFLSSSFSIGIELHF